MFAIKCLRTNCNKFIFYFQCGTFHLQNSKVLLRSEKPERHVRKASHFGSKQQ